MRLLIAALLLVGSCATKPAAPWKETPQLGFQLDNQNTTFNPALMGKISKAIRVENVIPNSSAARAGLKPGDYILGKENPKKFYAEIEQLGVGKEITLDILSGVKTRKISLRTETQRFSSGSTLYPANLNLWDLNGQKSYLQTRLPQNSADLQHRFQLLAERGDAVRPLSLVSLQRHPFQIKEVQSEILARFQKCKADLECLENLQIIPTGLLSVKTPLIKLRGSSVRSHLQYISEVLDASDKITQRAFTQLNAVERDFLARNSRELSEKFKESSYVHDDYFVGRKDRYYESFKILEKINYKYFSESLHFLNQHFSSKYFHKLEKDLSPLAKKEIIAEMKTSQGLIVIAGSEPNDHYRPHTKTRFIFDLGGDDLYRDNEGIIVDMNGNDRYESSVAWTLAGATLKSSLLLDFDGNDTYECLQNCLGSSLLGSSLFIDFQGDDHYNTGTYSLGLGFSGLGIFIDATGNDTYVSLDISQGVGVAGGYGFMVDLDGDDSYSARGVRPSSYGDPGQFEGCSQGVGIGLRFFVSGGVGMLYDRKGRDTFEAGTFSQGGGYYFGWGAFINDGQDDDTYSGQRYTQGFGAHSAVGTFLDVGGNDLYRSASRAGNGLGWDLSLALFEDYAGDDSYQTGLSSLGVPSHNSFAFFIDYQGKDNYRGKDLPPSIPIVNDYHGGKSLGLFLDSGGSHDQYERFKNNSSLTRENSQTLIDE